MKSRKKRPNPQRDRIEIRSDPEWIDRVLRHANNLGLSISAYIRLAVNEKMQREREPDKEGQK
jgi:hypothetical protein